MKYATQSLNANKLIKATSKLLRREQTSAEEFMWQMIRNRRLNGLKFRRQHPIDKFVADFYCHELKFAVELDGDIHELESVKQKDNYKENRLKKLGINVIRFSNDDVFRNTDWVANEILKFASRVDNRPSPRPSPRGNLKGSMTPQKNTRHQRGDRLRWVRVPWSKGALSPYSEVNQPTPT